MHEERALRRRKVPLLRRADVVRRASCCLPESASLRVARRTRAYHCVRCLSQRGASRKLAARACRAALALMTSCTSQGHSTGERPLCFGARPWCDVPAAASQNQLVLAWHARARHCARCLLGAGASRELAAHAHHAALAVGAPHTRLGRCSGERPLSFAARPWCDVPDAASQNQPAFAWHAGARHRARCLSREGALRKRAVRVPWRDGCDRSMH
jgi:hypothetical protein